MIWYVEMYAFAVYTSYTYFYKLQAHFRVSSWRLDPGAVGVGGAVALCRVGSCRSPEAAAQGSHGCRKKTGPFLVGMTWYVQTLEVRVSWTLTDVRCFQHPWVTSPFPKTALTDHHLFFPVKRFVTRYRLRIQATELFHVGPFYTRQLLELLQIKEVPVRVARTLAVHLIVPFLFVCLFVCLFVRLFVRSFVCLFVCLSVCLFAFF